MAEQEELEVAAPFPKVFAELFKPHRYKVFWGGRGGAKSWAYARALLLLGMQRPLRVLCAREMQKSLKDSVHKLLSDQIELLGLQDKYDVIQSSIRGKEHATEFFFDGVAHNVAGIKSYEGIDICWVEEAESVTKSSWGIIIPTIRKKGSEIWISFNPRLETDETYQRFVLNPPSSAYVRKVGWQDNPWFTEELRDEMEELRSKDQDEYLHVWEGHCRSILEGAVYAAELRDSVSFKRITRVPYDPTKPVDTVWDLGYSDMTSIWFVQRIGYEIHLIDFYQNRLKGPDHYMRELRNRDYIYDLTWLPHDAQAKQMSAGGLTIQEQIRAKGFKTRIVPRHSLVDGIAAARTIFSGCYFDAERCADGINALRCYRYDVVDDKGNLTKVPVHDAYSHAADAFRYMAMSIKQPRKYNPDAPDDRTLVQKAMDWTRGSVHDFGPQGWMD